MGKKVLLIGLGMQGRAALHDLAAGRDVSGIVIVDNRPDLSSDLSRFPAEKADGRNMDARDEEGLSALMRGADIVVEALPGSLAPAIGRLAAECGVSLVSSMYYRNPEEQDARKQRSGLEAARRIDGLAKEKGITILTEFGLDPGLDLVIGARAIGELDEVHEFHTYGAGLPGPAARPNPLKYKFSWSAVGVMKSYRRPARVIRGGRVAAIPAAEVFEERNIRRIEVEDIGAQLECFPNGDSAHYAELFGIRDSVKEMGRYTGRFSGHCAFWDIMVKSGFLDDGLVRAGKASVSPLEFITALLSSQPQFQYADDEDDMTLLRVDVRGIRQGKRVRVIHQLIDRRDFKTGLTSMQRTVGFAMSRAARLILQGKLKPGLLTPLDVPYDLVIPALEKHNMRVTRREVLWN